MGNVRVENVDLFAPRRRRMNPHGTRPGVRMERAWYNPDWDQSGYYFQCDHRPEQTSLDPTFHCCPWCGLGWRGTTGAPAIQGQCASCANKAARRPAHLCAIKKHYYQLNVCIRCGVFLCYDHSHWTADGIEDPDAELVCLSCLKDINRAEKARKELAHERELARA
jgi:hypothetical protein